jgi:hypothetical protein
MDQATTLAIIAVLVAGGSEVIALLPIRENSWVQLSCCHLPKVLQTAFPKRTQR